MKDNIFAHWLRELCSLVFIQSIQAFIFAIVMSLIISIMTPDNVGEIGDENRSDYIAATGIIAVLAISSISKLEDLVKKIFGVQSSVTDTGMRGGMKSLATTMMAANLAKGVLDNAGKVAGGIGGWTSANRSMNKQRARLARKVGNEGGPQIGEGSISGGTAPTPQLGESGNGLPNTGGNTSNNAGRNSSASSSRISTENKRAMSKDLQKAYDDYEDKMEELKAKKRASRFKIASGVNETLGAIGGGMTGALIGASIGEGKEIMNGALAGIGIGDKLGSAPVRTIETAANANAAIQDISKQRQNLVREVNSMNEEARQALANNKKIRTQYSKARAELDRQLKSFDISDL